ncbi:MAG: peptidylprolyl isomerase [Thermodesulfobacteriota bacterium]|nr:peptidylprolyl isomerase [Thermodesulfobacteriota bacterium]
MSTAIKINDEVVSAEQFINILKMSNEFPLLAEKVIRDKITVQEAKKKGISVSTEEVQQEADDFRRVAALHRAKDTQEWMDQRGLTLDEFEIFVTERIYKKKMVETITSEQSIEEYFKLNSPKFDSADIRHIVVDSEAKAKELMSLLSEDPEGFGELAKEHSLDNETRKTGGQIGGLRRGVLPDEVSAKVFNASAGDVVGPLELGDGYFYEIIQVTAVNPASLDDSTKEEIGELLYNDWLEARLQEHSVTV